MIFGFDEPYMQVLIPISIYSHPLAFFIFGVSAVFIYRAGFKVAAYLMGFGALLRILIMIFARATYSEEMVELLDESGKVIGMQFESSLWNNIQMPTESILIFILSCSVLFLAIQLQSATTKA